MCEYPIFKPKPVDVFTLISPPATVRTGDVAMVACGRLPLKNETELYANAVVAGNMTASRTTTPAIFVRG